ncbi:M28 family metallopeptidase [Corallococcus exiguus]|uniref:M20/M25/M40 family metallo-hydrolase n=1 Tax=Corallococcus exiguus TaxID=83462 RepID=A0A7X4YDK7_9BACT|nr:M28 family metallopeptidase [Corallococcus exiguus]NBC43449.1 M20/M25/M40 family metallo-hydrolase [Corallococcus exiguus]TNV50261.1 M20/M25/M40 family metallo-hydrolase [Corallococcus exiguus]
MKRVSSAATLALFVSSGVFAAEAPASRSQVAEDRWWKHVEVLASDAMEGRDTGSKGYATAAGYVSKELASLGVKPMLKTGFLQPMALQSRRLIESKSSVALVKDGKTLPLVQGEDVVLSSRQGDNGTVDAPLVFVGYGLSIPELGHDDYAGLDLKGKVVVMLQGGPGNIPGPVKSHFSSWAERLKVLKAAGAVGVVYLQNPKLLELPWERVVGSNKNPTVVFADPSLNDSRGLKVTVVANVTQSQKWLEGAPHTYEELVALANADKPLPKFDLPLRLKAKLAFDVKPLKSMNVVGVMPGTDPVLAKEYVVLSAHLDHVGVGEPVKGDRIYNGAMDNASGVAAVLEVARQLHDQQEKPKRSVVFALVTGEEKGLLGSKYFASRPPVPITSIVADFNLDMFMPHWPFTSVVAHGKDESSLAVPLAEVAAKLDVQVLADPEPDRNLFVRSDQYSFIREGVPALFFKFGYTPDSEEQKVFKQWLTERYHAPSDDLSQQPVDHEGAARFITFLTALTNAVADAPGRPYWNDDSFFRRFAKPAPEADPAP